jgi:transcriptional regulator with XRE-family HTH domain
LHDAHHVRPLAAVSVSEALLARRKLGNELLRLREEAGRTQAQVGKILWTSGTTVHRMEQGRSQIKGPQIGALLRGLAIDDPKLEERLVHLAELSQDGSQPYDKYRERLSNEALQFFGYEQVATTIRVLQLFFVPGLLQTDEYAGEVIRSVQGIEGDIEGFLLPRRDRQQNILFRSAPPTLSFMIDEAVLYRPFGSTAIMTAQLLKLQELAGRPDVSINVVPLALGASPALRGSFTLLEFDDYPDVLFMESPRGDTNVYEQEATAARRATWNALEARLAPEPPLGHYIQKALDKL